MISPKEFQKFCVELADRSDWKAQGWNWIPQKSSRSGFLSKKNHFREFRQNQKKIEKNSFQQEKQEQQEDQEPDNDIQEIDSSSIITHPSDSSSSSSDSDSLIFSFEYHVVFSPVYQVPVLYFNATRIQEVGSSVPSEDLSISREEVLEFVVNRGIKPENELGNDLRSNEWTFLSQGVSSFHSPILVQTITQQTKKKKKKEHPILGEMFFFLHPCQTADLMNTMLNLREQPKDSSNNDNENQRSFNNYVASWLSFVSPVIGLNLPFRLFLKEVN